MNELGDFLRSRREKTSPASVGLSTKVRRRTPGLRREEVAALAGIGIGSTQSVTRSLVALFTPKENAAEFFGFLGIAGKALAFLGPLVFGTISKATGSQRPAILSIGIFFVAGIVALSFVDERAGKAASRIPVGSSQ